MKGLAILSSLALLVIVTACSGNADQPGPTATTAATAAATATEPPAEASPTLAPSATATAQPSATPTVEPEEGIGSEAIWEPRLSLDRLLQACEKIGPECLEPLAELERQDGAPEAAIDFFLAHEAFLVSFQEHGAVDYGAVSLPFFNMGRPEPVFLNGETVFLYVGEVIPQDWQSEPSYTEVAEALIWSEYSRLTGVTTAGTTQVFAIEVPIQDCRACEPLGAVSLEVSFEAGALADVAVLPLVEPAGTPTP